jgi:hypothetical protein
MPELSGLDRTGRWMQASYRTPSGPALKHEGVLEEDVEFWFGD